MPEVVPRTCFLFIRTVCLTCCCLSNPPLRGVKGVKPPPSGKSCRTAVLILCAAVKGPFRRSPIYVVAVATTVGLERLELSILAAPVSKTGVYTNSTTNPYQTGGSNPELLCFKQSRFQLRQFGISVLEALERKGGFTTDLQARYCYAASAYSAVGSATPVCVMVVADARSCAAWAR